MVIDREEIRNRARAFWDAQPSLELAYGSFGSFLEVRIGEALQRGEEREAIEFACRETHARRCADAASRLASVRSPLYALSANTVEATDEHIDAWCYRWLGDVDGNGKFIDVALAKAIDDYPGARSLTLRIASFGGQVDVLDRMTATLKRFAGETTAIIDTAASSCGADLALRCQHVVMREGATLMIHRTRGTRHGDCAQLRAAADSLEQIDDRLTAEIFASRPKADRAAVLDAIENETYLTADRALAIGLIDEITRPLPFFEKTNA
jgi:ATP-dependent protease ClpP protease subunit